MIEVKLFSALTTSTVVTAVVSDRVYPVILPQEPTYPAITYMRLADSPLNTLLGRTTNLDNPTFEINIWSTSYNTSKNLMESVHSVLNDTTYLNTLLTSNRDLYEDGLNTEKTIYRISADFSVWGV